MSRPSRLHWISLIALAAILALGGVSALGALTAQQGQAQASAAPSDVEPSSAPRSHVP